MKTKMLALLLLSTPLLAAPPRITNGTVEVVPSIAQAESVPNGWIGYAIETPKGFSSCGCNLASDNNNITRRSDDDDLGPGGTTALLFIRMRDGRPDKFRFFTPECNINGAGQTIRWVDNVSERESVAFLKRIADNGTDHAYNGALLALTLQPSGTDALIDIARNNASSHVRGQALFWLSQAAGAKAAAALRAAADNDPEESVRAKAVFGISQLPNDQSIPLLVDLMKHNRSREVRKKAAFWLGQKNDPRALQAIEDVLRQ
jgi:HEAT repeats